MFPETEVVKKIDVFEHDLRVFVADNTPDNREVYKFCLTHGLSPKKAREVLRTMQERDELIVTDLTTARPARKGAFYLTADGYYKDQPRARFSLAGDPA